MSPRLALLAPAALCLALAACAEGSSIGPFGDGSGDGGSGDGGPRDGGRRGDGGRSGDGGASTVGASTSGSASSTGVTTTGVTTGVTTTGVTTGVTTTGVTTGVTSVASSTSSGGSQPCDPLNPGPECGANMGCFPVEVGDPVCEPAGSTDIYGPCDGAGQCVPTSACVDVGDIFAFPCCLQFCRSTPDCGGLGDCYFFDPPVYADGVEFGVCFDGLGGC